MPKDNQLKTKADLADAANVNRSTVASWARRPDFPKPNRAGVWDAVDWAKYSKVRQEDAAKKQTGKDSDLKRIKLQKQIRILEIDILKAERDDEIHKIEHEAKRGLWYNVDQVKEFAALVASAFDDGVAAVELATRDAGAVKSVSQAFDRIRTRLAEELA